MRGRDAFPVPHLQFQRPAGPGLGGGRAAEGPPGPRGLGEGEEGPQHRRAEALPGAQAALQQTAPSG